ncbi:MAG: hypothetical protein LBG81_08900 [Coriobacteriaceae bacterium]|jgi:hypothetical protein|nr:hypothetical protein [Coriobacteriaceae bacterium]
MHNRTRKTTITVCLCLIVVSIAVSLFYVNYEQESERNRKELEEQYIVQSTRVYQLNETAVLDSQEDEKCFQFGTYYASLGYDGIMEMTLTEATLYGSSEETGLPIAKVAPLRDPVGSSFLVVRVKLKNVAIEDFYNPDGFLFVSTYVNLIHKGNPSYGVAGFCYFDGTDPDADPIKGAAQFRLAKGEEKTFTIAFEVPKEELREGLCIGAGLAYRQKYTFDLGLGFGQGGGGA